MQPTRVKSKNSQLRTLVATVKKAIRFCGHSGVITSSMLTMMLLLTGCDKESYHTFQRTFSGEQTLVYAINATGNTDLTGYITSRDVLESLVGKAPDRKYRSIDNISIKSMKIVVDKNANNAADSFRLLSITAMGSWKSKLPVLPT